VASVTLVFGTPTAERSVFRRVAALIRCRSRVGRGGLKPSSHFWQGRHGVRAGGKPFFGNLLFRRVEVAPGVRDETVRCTAFGTSANERHETGGERSLILYYFWGCSSAGRAHR
jgi:hypothetical protein